MWRKWDGTGTRQRPFIDPNSDEIFYYREYTAGKDYNWSETNNFVNNFKKGVAGRTPHVLRYREVAISQCADEFSLFLKEFKKTPPTWISWIPTSKIPTDPEYDDRFVSLLSILVQKHPFLEQVEIFRGQVSRQPLHHGGTRDPDLIKRSYEWVCRDLSSRKFLLVIDDVLTTGASFRAFADKVKERYPGIVIAGLFWAITINEADEL